MQLYMLTCQEAQVEAVLSQRAPVVEAISFCVNWFAVLEGKQGKEK